MGVSTKVDTAVPTSILIDSVDAVAAYASKWEGLYSDDSPAFKSPFASDWEAIEREKSRAVH